MTNIHSNPTPLRQKFIEYLTLNRKAERTVHTYVSFIYSLAKHCRRSPDLLGHEDIRQWLYHLIAERKQAPSTVNLAINAVRSFYGGLLQREIEPLLHQIKRPRRPRPGPTALQHGRSKSTSCRSKPVASPRRMPVTANRPNRVE